MVKQGLDVNAKDKKGTLALHNAALSGNLELVQWLVKQGLDVNAKDHDGQSVLFYAVVRDNLELIQWLVEQGADINAKDNDGNSILFHALRGHVEQTVEGRLVTLQVKTADSKTIQWLKEHGAK